MKKFIVIVSASLLALPLLGQEKSPQLKDQKDKVSYSIGMNIGFNLSRQKVDVNPDILAAGIKDIGVDRKSTRLNSSHANISYAVYNQYVHSFPTRRSSDLKKFIVIVSASLLALPLLGQEKSPQLKDQKDKVSYSIGMNIGFNLSRQKVDVNPDILAAGIKDIG